MGHDDCIALGDDYRLLVKAINELHARQSPSTIEIRTLPNTAFERGLADSGFSKKSEQLYTFILRGLSKSVADECGLMRGDIDLSKLASWYLTYLDVL